MLKEPRKPKESKKFTIELLSRSNFLQSSTFPSCSLGQIVTPLFPEVTFPQQFHTQALSAIFFSLNNH